MAGTFYKLLGIVRKNLKRRNHNWASTLSIMILSCIFVIMLNGLYQLQMNEKEEQKKGGDFHYAKNFPSNFFFPGDYEIEPDDLNATINNTKTRKNSNAMSDREQVKTIIRVTSIFFIFSFYPIFNSVLKDLVIEKKNGIRELMKVMGMKDWVLWFGYFVDAIFLSLLWIFVNFYSLSFSRDNIKPMYYNCEKSLLFCIMVLYLISCTAFAFGIASFFSSAILAELIGMLLFLLLPFLAVEHLKSVASDSRMTIFSLIPNLGFYFCTEQIENYREEGTMLDWNNANVALGEGISVATALLMLFIGGVLYFAMAVYAINIFPGPYGMRKPLLYPCQLRSKKVQVEEDIAEEIPTKYFESEAPPDLPVGIKVKNLRKEFGNVVAINNFSINIYKGEITVILGHNGAGKTTLLSILTGLMRPTGGTAFIDGYNVKYNIDKIRQSLGICMQTDIHDRLTVMEHLMFFAMIKGIGYRAARFRSNKQLRLLSLQEKKNHLPSQLSGGLKRRLSIAIGLVGNPKLLVLDEPSSGLDPESRRQIWDVLLESREKRTVIITTHMLEEADVLGDRIAIMHLGQLVCFGTSFYLKKRFGSGYRFQVLCSDVEKSSAKITNIVTKTVSNATLHSATGKRLNYQLPEDQKSSFTKLFKQIENDKANLNILAMGLTIATLEDVYVRIDQLIEAEKGEDTRQVSPGMEAIREKQNLTDADKLKGTKKHLVIFKILLKKRAAIAFRERKILLGQIVALAVITCICLRLDDKVYEEKKMSVQLKWGSFFSIGFTAMMALCIRFLHMERATKVKQLQLMSGTYSIEYWLVCICWDVLNYLELTLIVFLTINCHAGVERNIFETTYEQWVLFVVLITYMCAIIPYIYLFSYYKTVSRGYTLVLLLPAVAYLILELSKQLLYKLHPDEDMKPFEKTVHFLFPMLVFVDVLNEVSALALMRFEDSQQRIDYFDEYMCAKLGTFIGSAIFYLIILALLHIRFIKIHFEKVKMTLYTCYRIIVKFNVVVSTIKDDDVRLEENRIFQIYDNEKSHPQNQLREYSQQQNYDLILAHNLHKIFCCTKVLNGVSFAIKPGDCFGLLGVNGAGKTTTFRLITGDLEMSKGNMRLYVKNKFVYISSQSRKLLRHIGYCPQEDSIIPVLTGREMLLLFANLRGIARNKSQEVDIWLKALGLEECADRRCGTYSGGNKRKLSVAMALIGDPLILLLDEPTTGVDPVSRRKIWTIIDILQKKVVKPSIILTSHSMEECEALCTTLVIMKNGQLACYGDIVKLKETYGLGFVVNLKLKYEYGEAVVDLIETFEETYESRCELINEHAGLLQYRIKDRNKTWSQIFQEMESFKNQHSVIDDYNITEVSIEELFLAIARS